MTGLVAVGTAVFRLGLLVGRWAAEKLGLAFENAKLERFLKKLPLLLDRFEFFGGGGFGFGSSVRLAHSEPIMAKCVV